MNARLALNLGLIGLIGILVMLAVYEPGLEAPKRLPRLTAITGSAVKAITITRAAGDPIVLVKDGERWNLRAPFPVAANAARVQSILDFLEGTSETSFPARGHDLERFGLADPKVRLEVEGESFAFGDTNPLSARRYVLYKDHVHLTAETLYDQLLADPGDFVSPRLVEEGSELTAIQLPGTSAERRESGWMLYPQDPTVKPEDVARLADQWRSAQALKVRKRRNVKAQETVSLERKDAAALRFEVLAHEPDLVLGRPDLGLEYRLDASMAERLFRPGRTEEPEQKAGERSGGTKARDPAASP